MHVDTEKAQIKIILKKYMETILAVRTQPSVFTVSSLAAKPDS